MPGKDYISLDYDRVVTETEMAICLAFGDERPWIPKSLIDPEFFPLDEEGGEVAIEFWKAKELGLEEYES
jgi:hypothetical protein